MNFVMFINYSKDELVIDQSDTKQRLVLKNMMSEPCFDSINKVSYKHYILYEYLSKSI